MPNLSLFNHYVERLKAVGQLVTRDWAFTFQSGNWTVAPLPAQFVVLVHARGDIPALAISKQIYNCFTILELVHWQMN